MQFYHQRGIEGEIGTTGYILITPPEQVDQGNMRQGIDFETDIGLIDKFSPQFSCGLLQIIGMIGHGLGQRIYGLTTKWAGIGRTIWQLLHRHEFVAGRAVIAGQEKVKHDYLHAAVDGNISPGIIYSSGGIMNYIGLSKGVKPENALLTVILQAGAPGDLLRIRLLQLLPGPLQGSAVALLFSLIIY